MILHPPVPPACLRYTKVLACRWYVIFWKKGLTSSPHLQCGFDCRFSGGYAGWGVYAATKFAIAGLTEALAAEVAEFGVKATLVYPGPVRTEFLSSGSLVVAQHSIPEYTAAQDLLDLHLNEMAGAQAGDPDKVAELIVQAADAPKSPLHRYLLRPSWHQ